MIEKSDIKVRSDGLPLFDWIARNKNNSVFVVNEDDCFYDLESVLEQAKQKKLIIHCRDCVGPISTIQMEEKFVHLISSNRTSDDLFFVSVNHYPELENFKNYFYFPEYHAYYYSMYQNPILDDSVLNKKFLSLNKREDISRQLLYMKFYDSNLLVDSYFSYLGEDTCWGELNQFHQWDYNYQLLTEWNPEIASWKIPPTKYVRIEDDQLLSLYETQRKNPALDPTWMPNVHWYQTSFCSVICETGTSANKPNFSEKTFRSIMQGHPFVIVGATNSISMLKNLGFDTFDDIIDHGYDQIDDFFWRQMKAFESIDRIASESYQTLHDLKKHLLPRRIFNIENYKRLNKEMLIKQELILEKVKQFVQS